jgi:protein kinase-like protein/PEGA domain-containing protein
MSTKIGHFEILSELAKSPTSTVYKANDGESGQTVALKAIQLSAFGEHAAELSQSLLREAENTKVLSSPNITSVFGAGEIEGQFCAAMEYIQGNSIATMLARNEGFSIWDLLDIGRQLCSGLDHAASHKIVHYSLEPAKIMCGWDGTVKIMSFGVSSVGNFVHHASGGVSPILHYMSPEQVRGESTDGRSNLFSLGAMFYEMVTERKAFDREDVESLRESILESTPVAPIQVNPKVHPLLSDLIMKALAKDPAERFQNGRELLDQLEKCKESKPAAAKKAEAPKGLVVPDKVKASVQTKFAGAAAPKPAAKPAAAVAAPRPAATVAQSSTSVASPVAKPAEKPASIESRPSALARPSKLAVPKSAAAAAGVGTSSPFVSSPAMSEAGLSAPDQADPVEETNEVGEAPSASMSSAVEEPPVETAEPEADADAPRIAVDPLMSGAAATGGGGVSFSEMTELPPLKEVYIPPPPPPPVAAEPAQSFAPTVSPFRGGRKTDEKPRVQPREVAQKAIKEIKGVPPKLMFYALAAAGIIIVIIAIGITIYIHSLNSDEDSNKQTATPAVEQAAAQPEAPPQPIPQKAAAAPAPVESQPAEVSEPEPSRAPERAATPSKSRGAKKKAAAPVVIPGQLAVDSTPQGAQVQVDGQTDPSWVTPFALTNLQPGSHSVTVSKAGYSTDTRSVEVGAGARANTMIHLSQLMATLVVKSDPAGANVYVDGHDVGAKTPAQVTVNKGQHVVLVRLSGYLDETMNAQFALGQTFNFSPSLRPLGNADSIKTVGKMSKLFGGKAQAGQAVVSIHTQPKGAQVSVNQHMLEKNSPVDVALDPGNYVIDINLTGYAPVHKVITADKGSKVVVDETLQPQ